jgi:hypothetical protein
VQKAWIPFPVPKKKEKKGKENPAGLGITPRASDWSR